MRIAQVAPLFESVPPKFYGGTERVVSYLTEELVRQGHEVTLFASGDSVTHARLEAICPEALRLGRSYVDRMVYQILQLERVAEQASDFDVVHFHIDSLHYPLVRRLGIRGLSTLHGRLDIPDLAELYREYREIAVSSISDRQRDPLPWLNWQGTVYHGLQETHLRPTYRTGRYLAFLGRFSPEKRADRAIEIAGRAGLPIKLAAKVDESDRKYFESVIRPLLKQPHVEYVGEISEREKETFLGDALALLFPIDWSEPFGLVMIEAMACGTPVIAYPCGSVPEVLDHGVTGFLVESISEAVAAVDRIPELSRKQCREVFEQRFSARRMAADYLTIYSRVMAQDEEALSSDGNFRRANGRHYPGTGSVLRTGNLLSG